MPNATISPDNTERFELKTLEGAYVVLRRMSYNAYLIRRDMLMKIQLASRGGGADVGLGSMQMMNHRVAVFDFKECVVDHNLEDANGNQLDLTKESTFRTLDPRVGTEVSDLISDMNEPLEDEELGN